MSDDAKTLQEFLVALGVKVDEDGMKKFNEGLIKLTKQIQGFAKETEQAVEKGSKNFLKLFAGFEAVATAIGIGAVKFAGKLEDLNFVAKRTGTSVNYIEALEKATQNFGGKAGDATSALEALTAAMRDDPGAAAQVEGLLRAVGHSAYDAAGNLKAAGDIFTDLHDSFKDKPFWLAHDYGQELGLDDQTLIRLRNNDFIEEIKKQQQALSGVDYTAAAEQAQRFDTSMRNLETTLGNIKTKTESGILTSLQPELDKLGKWVDVHQDQIASFTENFATGMLAAAQIVVPVLDRITEGWKRIFEWVGAGGQWVADHMPNAVGDAIGHSIDWALEKPAGPNSGATPASAPAAAGNSGGGWLARLHAVHADNELRLQGWSQEQRAGIIAALQGESPSLDPGEVGDHGKAYGIGQWHENFWPMFKKWSGGRDIHGSSLDQQLGFLNWDLTQGPDSTLGRLMKNLANNDRAQSAYLLTSQYLRPVGGIAEAEKRGAAAAVTINQTIRIDVDAHGDAHGVASAVGREQSKVNADMTRNLKSALVN